MFSNEDERERHGEAFERIAVGAESERAGDGYECSRFPVAVRASEDAFYSFRFVIEAFVSERVKPRPRVECGNRPKFGGTRQIDVRAADEHVVMLSELWLTRHPHLWNQFAVRTMDNRVVAVNHVEND